MTIRDFQKYLEDRKLIHKQNISSLNNTRIGIDGFYWLTNTLRDSNEPFQVAMGGTPLTFINRIDKELKKFKDAGITPVFVFNGVTHKKIDIHRKTHITSMEETDQKRRSAWNAYERGQVKEAAMLFNSTATGLPTDFINFIFKHFTKNNIEFFRAPYLTWAQLAHFSDKDKPLIHAIYAAEEQIMFNASRVILDINFQDQNFQYIDKKEILNNFNLTETQFLDSCILAGSFFGKTFPAVADITKQISGQTFYYAQDMVRHFRSGLHIVQHYASLDGKDRHLFQEYVNQFLMAKALISHHIIFDSTTCNALPLNPAGVPKDLHDVIGTRLPNELYYLLSQGVIAPTAISSLITGVVLESSPLADSQEYRNIISQLSSMRSTSFNLLTSCLNEYYQKKPVVVSCWYSTEHQELERSHLKIADSLSWQLSDADIQKQLKTQKAQKIDFQFCLNWKPTPSSSLTKITTNEHMRAFLILKSLDLLGYFTKGKNNTYELSPYARALQKAKIYPDQSMVVLELLKQQILTNKPFTPVFKRYQASVKVPTKKHKNEAELTLILRVMSMIPMKFKTTQWGDKAGVSQDLMSFNSVVKAVYRSIRQVFEMLLVSVFMNGYCGQELLQDLPSLAVKLPFFQEANTAMGIVSRHLLETPVEELNIDQMAKKFNSCKDCVGDFRDKAVPFWNQTLAMVRVLYSGKTSIDPVNGPAVLEQFEVADKFLQDRLGQIASLLTTSKQ